MQPHYSNGYETLTPTFGICFVLAYLLIILVILAFTVLVFCKIFSKAGYHWAMGLLALIPGVGQIIVLLMLAFGQWPIHRELQALKHSQMAPPPEGQPHESFRGN